RLLLRSHVERRRVEEGAHARIGGEDLLDRLERRRELAVPVRALAELEQRLGIVAGDGVGAHATRLPPGFRPSRPDRGTRPRVGDPPRPSVARPPASPPRRSPARRPPAGPTRPRARAPARSPP